MKQHSQILNILTCNNIEITNITPQLEEVISKNGIDSGFLLISSRHTKSALFVIEYEERLLRDINTFFTQLVLLNRKYLHYDILLRDCPPDEPENAHSLIIALLLSSSETSPVVDGKPAIDQWQLVQFAELDGPRDRMIQ